MSLLYITEDENLAWIHENLREHAIARGLMKNNDKNSIPYYLLSKWGFSPPTLFDIFCYPDNICSMELSEAIRRIIPNEALIAIAKRWLKGCITGYAIDKKILTNNDSNGSEISKLVDNCKTLQDHFLMLRNEENSHTRSFVKERNGLNEQVRLSADRYRGYREKREEMNKAVKIQKLIRTSANDNLKNAKGKVREVISKKHNLSKMSTKKVNQLINSYMLSDDEETADSCVKKEFREAINFHQQAHDILEDYSKTSQDAHESMLREGDILEELKQLANSAHESFKKSRSLSTKYHNEYIFLSKRLGRELNKRLRYLEMDNYLDKMKSDEIESQVKASITNFTQRNLVHLIMHRNYIRKTYAWFLKRKNAILK